MTVTIDLRGRLDEDQAERIVSAIRSSAGRAVELRIDSEGGKLGAAVAILLELEEHDKPVTTTIIGEASSAAFLVSIAGDRRRIDRRALMSIHHPSPYSAEGSADVRRAIVECTARPPAMVRRWMDGEQVFNADEAKRNGLVDSIVDVSSPPPVWLRDVKRRPATWLRQWRADCERLDLRFERPTTGGGKRKAARTILNYRPCPHAEVFSQPEDLSPIDRVFDQKRSFERDGQAAL